MNGNVLQLYTWYDQSPEGHDLTNYNTAFGYMNVLFTGTTLAVRMNKQIYSSYIKNTALTAFTMSVFGYVAK